MAHSSFRRIARPRAACPRRRGRSGLVLDPWRRCGQCLPGGLRMAEVRRVACRRRSTGLSVGIRHRARDETGNPPATPVAVLAGPTRARAIHRGASHVVLPDVECPVPFGLPLAACLPHVCGRPRRGRRGLEGGRISTRERLAAMNRLDAYFISLVFAHLGVVLAHTTAHLALQILPAPPDTAFILAVILIGPVAALPILRFNPSLASALLTVVMAAAFAYGFPCHFLIAGPDPAAIVGSNRWTLFIVADAVGFGLLEIASIAVGVTLFGRSVRNPSGHPARPR